MTSFSELLSPREWAILIFMALVVGASLSFKPTRKAFLGVLRALTQRAILIVLFIAATYIAALVFGLHKIGLWQTSDIPSTIVWMVTSASVAIFNFKQAQSDKRYYRKAFLEVFAVTTMFVFITDLLDFSLWFWLITIPILTFIHLLNEQAKRDHTDHAVLKLLSGLETLAGLVLLYLVAVEAWRSWDEIATMETLRLFALSGVLSVAFLPFIYGLALYASYETTFSVLPVLIKDQKLRRAAKWRAVWQFRTDTDFLRRWHQRIAIVSPNTPEELRATFTDMRTIKRRERNPQPVPIEQGWQPQTAIHFLANDGLPTNDYKQVLDEDEWQAISSYLEISEGIMPNNIGYYVTGMADAATTLKLKLNVNQPANDQEAKEQFSALSLKLARLSLDHQELDDDLAQKITRLAPFESTIGHVQIVLDRDDWQGGIRDGYSLRFIVSIP